MIGIHIVAGERSPLFDGIDRDVDWTGAACRSVDPELWFPDKGGSYEDARAICETCPIRQRCLDYAMRREHGLHRANRFGMWGGLTPEERAEMAQERRTA